MNNKLKVLTAGVLFFTGQTFLAQETANDSLSQEKKIDEVIIVGFGKKQVIKENTGSVSSIKGGAIEDIPVASVDKLLQGRTTGVQTSSPSGQPGGFASVRVRGVASINGVTEPIYILDGVRINSGELTSSSTTSNILSTLNPDDIESITVLKDAVSTAVYGADAGAGVVIINTKQGRRGKPRFSLKFSHGFSQKAVSTHKAMNSDQYKQYLTAMFENAGFDISSLENAVASGFPEAEYTELTSILNSPYNTDWISETERKSAYTRNADFSVSGGNSKVNYYLSANYFEQEGIVKGTDFKRLTFSSKNDYRFTDRLKVGANVQVAYSKTNTVPDDGNYENPLYAQYFLRPTDPVRNADGTWYFGERSSATGISRLSNNLFNTVATLDTNTMTAETAKIFGNFSLDYEIFKNFRYRFAFAPEYINIEEQRYLSPVHGQGEAYNGYLSARTRRLFSYNLYNVLSYNFSTGLNNFDFSAIQEAYRIQGRNLNATGTEVGSENLFTLSNFVKMHDMAGTKSRKSRYAYALTGRYNYDKLVLLDLSYRREYISDFTKNRKGGDFWSVGLGVDLARLNFLKENSVVSQLKMRSSYGQVGNQVSVNPYATYSYRDNYNDRAAASYSGILNTRLTWETIKPFNVGMDFGFFKDRIKFSAEYYNKKTVDMIYDLPLQLSQGQSSYTDNIGSLVNRGVELSLDADVFRGGREGVNMSVGFNFSTLTNKVKELYGGDVEGDFTLMSEGLSLGSFYMRKWAGVDAETGEALWYVNGVDGETTNDFNVAQKALQGTRLYKYFGGFNLNASYKGFGLDAQINYAFGGKLYDYWAEITSTDGFGTYNEPGYASQMDYWTPTNTGASYPKPVYGNQSLSYETSTRFLFKTDYIRLSTARLSYTFKAEQLRGTGLSSLQVYLMGTNLFTWKMDKNLKFDPEIGSYGYTRLAPPIMKTYSMGVNINF